MKKSIAIVSDIQSNKYALNDFLNFIDKREIQTIINLGNFLGNTIYSREILDRVFHDKRFINIAGPNEIMAIENKDNPYNLNEQALTLLRSLSKRREISIENKTFFMTHSNYCFQVNEQSLKAIFFNEIEKYWEGNFDYNYILYGCTNILDTSSYVKPIAKLQDEIIISPGNLFMHTQDSISFVVLTIHDEYESIETIKLKSDSKIMLSELISLDKYNTPLLSQYGYYNIFHNQGSMKLTCVSTKNNHKLKQNYELFKGFLKDCEVLTIFFLTQNEAEENKNLLNLKNSETKIVDEQIFLSLDFKQLQDNLLFKILFEKNLFEIHS